MTVVAALPRHIGSLVVAVLLFVPRLAAACPACFAASDVRVARMYMLTAALLSLLPLAIVGGIAWWWRHNHTDEPA